MSETFRIPPPELSSPAEPSSPVPEQGESYGRMVWRQFRKNTLGMVSLYFVGALAAVAIFADFLANDVPIVALYRGQLWFPVLQQYAVQLGVVIQGGGELIDWRTAQYDWALWPPVPYRPETTDPTLRTLRDRAPSARHWLGTDEIGRDVLAGIIHGARYALSIGFVAMGIALAIGILVGALAGYYGGVLDIILSRLIELVLTLPTFFLIITVVALVQQGSIWLIMAMIGLTGWTGVARFVRGEVLRVRTLEYVTAARALGFSAARIIFRHVLPNALAPVLVAAAFGIANAVLVESALSFLGFGVPPTVVTWGSMLAKARGSISAWWLVLFPGLLIFLTVAAYNLIGDALRDALDPRLRQ
ncbi:MAG: ABC transporter permease [Candidatus Kapabacteria bacterium]|nr:ABC transporter permease [Candidatus Kapabacteria bacterium]MDW8012378.1 ABC transporter permease [Bacteroidota bacterium]